MISQVDYFIEVQLVDYENVMYLQQQQEVYLDFANISLLENEEAYFDDEDH